MNSTAKVRAYRRRAKEGLSVVGVELPIDCLFAMADRSKLLEPTDREKLRTANEDTPKGRAARKAVAGQVLARIVSELGLKENGFLVTASIDLDHLKKRGVMMDVADRKYVRQWAVERLAV